MNTAARDGDLPLRQWLQRAGLHDARQRPPPARGGQNGYSTRIVGRARGNAHAAEYNLTR